MFLVSVDGQSRVLDENIALQVRKGDYTLRVVKRIGHTFYETLRDKLMWERMSESSINHHLNLQ